MGLFMLSFGKKSGKPLERMIFDDPGYILWMLDEVGGVGGLARARRALQQSIGAFDARPFVTPCLGKCARPVQRYSLYRNNNDPHFWCGSCDPYKWGAPPGRLAIRRSYEDALRHVQGYTGLKSNLRHVARRLLEGKGVTGKLTDKRLEDFFA